MRRPDGCDGGGPTMAGVTKTMEENKGGLKKKKHCNTRDHDWSICLWNRVLGGGRDDNGIWHFCLSWCLLCELKYKKFGAEMRKIGGR